MYTYKYRIEYADISLKCQAVIKNQYLLIKQLDDLCGSFNNNC